MTFTADPATSPRQAKIGARSSKICSGHVARWVPQGTVGAMSHQGYRKFTDLITWLEMPAPKLQAVVNLSASTLEHWREHPAAPVCLDEAVILLRFHTAVGLLVGELGRQQAILLLTDGGWLLPLNMERLMELEALVRSQLSAGPPTAPAGLAGLTATQLRNAVTGHVG